MSRFTLYPQLTTLFNFEKKSEFGSPNPSALTQGNDGNFYGTTQDSGVSRKCQSSGCGTIFQLTPTGQFTTLINFNGQNGRNPSGLTKDNDGNLYRITTDGGRGENGTIFKLTIR